MLSFLLDKNKTLQKSRQHVLLCVITILWKKNKQTNIEWVKKICIDGLDLQLEIGFV